jgi:hypothetical protein
MRHLLPLLLLFTCSSSVIAQVKATPPGGPSSASALVAQLGDRDYRTREAAGQKLLALGEKALPAVEAGIGSPVPEVARRCEDLLAALKHKIEADALLAPTMVDLPGGATSVQKAFDSLTRQSRYALRVEGDQAVLAEAINLPGGRVPFWEAVDAIATAAKLQVHQVTADPVQRPPADVKNQQPPLGTISMRAATGTVRAVVHKSVLIQVTPPTKDELAQHPPDRCPLIVRLFPEPRMKWHRVSEVVSAKATDEKGGAILPALSLPVSPQRMQEELLSSRPPTRLSPSGFTDAAMRGVLSLSAEPTVAAEVGTLKGVVRFTAWRPSAALATVNLADGETTADGPHGTQLKVKVIGPIANEPDSTTLEIAHRWDPLLVKRDAELPDSGGGRWFENVNGRLVPVKAPEPTGPKPNQWGLTVVNAAGEPLSLTAGGTRIDDTTHLGVPLTTMSATYVVRQGKLTDGKPAAVSFHAARVVEVGVPFTVKDLPLAAGTGQQVEFERRWKR